MNIFFLGELVNDIGGIGKISIFLLRFLSIFLFCIGKLVALNVHRGPSLFLGGIIMGYAIALFIKPYIVLIITMFNLISMIGKKR